MSIITTNAHGVIQLPELKHVNDSPWKFTTPEWTNAATLIFESTSPIGITFSIVLTDTEDMPYTRVEGAAHEINAAEKVYDLEYAISHGFTDWLHECAEVFEWCQTLAAEHRLATLINQQQIKQFQQELRNRDTPEIMRESDEDEADVLPFVWADAGMDCMVDGDVNTSVYEYTGGVGVDDLGACAVTKRRYFTRTGEARGTAEETFRLDSTDGEIPAAGAFRVAAAIALAVVGMDNNRPTADPETVDDLAGRISADAHELLC